MSRAAGSPTALRLRTGSPPMASACSSGPENGHRGCLGCHIPSDSDTDAGSLGEDVELAFDLFDRSSVHMGSADGSEVDPFTDVVDPFGFGVFDDAVEEMGPDQLELEMRLGLQFELDESHEERGGVLMSDLEEEEEEERADWPEDGFYVGRRGELLESDGGEPSGSWNAEGMRAQDFGLDSDSDEEKGIMAASPDSHISSSPDCAVDDMELPLFCDRLCIDEERWNPNEDFEWEEIDGRLDERDVLSMVIDAEEDRSIALEDPNENLGLGEEDFEEEVQNLEWEVLLAMNNLERNMPIESDDAQSFVVEDNDDHVYASEFDVLFGQFIDQENSTGGCLPAAKSVIERLLTVAVAQLALSDHNALCAVCKDEFSLGEKVKQLPCMHHFHEDCIIPWLKIRCTCPVCRYKLPTDESSDCEDRRAQRAGSGGTVR